MARTSRRDDEDALDPIEAADVDADDPDETEGFTEQDPDGFDAAAADEIEDELEDELDDDLDDADEDDDSAGVPVPDDDPEALDGEPDILVPPPAEAAFDDDDDDIVAVVTSDDDEVDDEVEGLRDGEFVCRSCFMAKRETQLADAERLLCRDCA